MLKALFLDVDGVIVTGDHFSTRLESDHGLTHDVTDVFFGDAFQKCLVGKADLKQEIAPYLPKWGWDKGVDAFIEYWFTVHSKIDQWVLNLVNQVRAAGITPYLATNQEKYRAQYLWEILGFKKYFDNIFASSRVGYLKTEPEFFPSVLQSIGVTPEAVLFCDDAHHSVASAKQVGLSGVVYTNYTDLEKELQKYLVN
jgi:putative hydrolase of the HAD superfamily